MMQQIRKSNTKGVLKRIFWFFCAIVFAVFVLVFYVPVQTLGISVDPDFGKVDFPGAELEYFDISGDTGLALKEQIRQKGLLDGTADAITYWEMGWEYSESTDGDGSCSIINPKVTYSIKVVFPRWVDPQRAPYALLKGWQDFVIGAARHEQNHVNIVLDNASRVERAILQAGCGKAKDAAQKAYQEIIDLQLQYDAETDHGRLEGIIFPA